MNKQIIEQAIAWNEDLLVYAKDNKATYEDVCGTGDMTDEERKQIYDSMDRDIEMFENVISALNQQLNNGWIPVSERLPEETDHYTVTTEYPNDGKRQVERVFFASDDITGEPGWRDVYGKYRNIVAWKSEEPYTEVSQ